MSEVPKKCNNVAVEDKNFCCEGCKTELVALKRQVNHLFEELLALEKSTKCNGDCKKSGAAAQVPFNLNEYYLHSESAMNNSISKTEKFDLKSMQSLKYDNSVFSDNLTSLKSNFSTDKESISAEKLTNSMQQFSLIEPKNAEECSIQIKNDQRYSTSSTLSCGSSFDSMNSIPQSPSTINITIKNEYPNTPKTEETPKSESLPVTPPQQPVHIPKQEIFDWGIQEAVRPGRWVLSANGAIPRGAIKSGGTVSKPTYIGRATMDDFSIVPGKLEDVCWVPWNNTEIKMSKYEVLVDADVFWVPHNASTPLPRNAVVAGYILRPYGFEKLYIGRNNIGNLCVPGYVFEKSRELLHSTCFRNQRKYHYEILVYR